MTGEIDRPVDVARLLVDGGVSLKRAHAVLGRLGEGETVAVESRHADREEAVRRLKALGVEASELKVPSVSTKDIRTRLKLSQSDFALRFGFELDTVQNWDQGRNQPDAAARILLALIDRDPALVEAVLTSRPKPRG